MDINLEDLKKRGDFISFKEITKLINLDLTPQNKVLVIGGSELIPGAALLTLRAAKKCGAKGVAFASTENVISNTEILYAGALKLIKMKDFSKEEFKEKIMPKIKDYGCVIIGPGMFFDNDSEKEGVKYFLKNYNFKTPLIIDANAIDVIVENPEIIKKIKSDLILTPNLKEFEAIIKKKINKNNISKILEEAKKLCKNTNITLLIKGAVDIITNGKKNIFNIAGHPVFAIAGSGDCVAGCIGGFLSLNNTPLSATSAGIYVFSRAGNYSYREVGYSLDPVDVLDNIPKVMKEILDFNTVSESRYYA